MLWSSEDSRPGTLPGMYQGFFRFGACPSNVGDSSVGTSLVGGFAVGSLPGSSEGASPLNWTRLAGQTIAFPR